MTQIDTDKQRRCICVIFHYQTQISALIGAICVICGKKCLLNGIAQIERSDMHSNFCVFVMKKLTLVIPQNEIFIPKQLKLSRFFSNLVIHQ